MADVDDEVLLEGQRDISLYEIYVLAIDKLLLKAPWELGRAVSPYHEMFLTEQRCIGLTIVLLLGEDYVPQEATESMPGFESQTRASINQAVFMRALKSFFERTKFDASRAEKVLSRMVPYITEARAANMAKKDPLKLMLDTIYKRVPPKDEGQKQQYTERIDKMYAYIEDLVMNDLLKRYQITS